LFHGSEWNRHNGYCSVIVCEVEDMTIMANSVYNGWRFEDVWLDR